MSCAVMFQPCFTAENLSLNNTKTDASLYPFSSMIPIAQPSSYANSFQHAHEGNHSQHGIPNATQLKTHQMTNATQVKMSKVLRHSPPLTDHDNNRKGVKKLCTSNRESFSSSSMINSPSVSEVHHKQASQSVTSPTPATPQINESDVKYLSANCVVVTHYRGETSAVVDEHFSRALSTKAVQETELQVKLPLKNFPPSFYQPQITPRTPFGFPGTLGAHSSSELYDAYHGSLHSLQSTSGADPWAYSFSPQAYSHRSVGPDVYHSAMATPSNPYQYSALGFQQHFSRLPSVSVTPQMNKGDVWGGRYYDSFVGASSDITTGLDASSYSASHFHNTAGIESGMNQECAKDLYWL